MKRLSALLTECARRARLRWVLPLRRALGSVVAAPYSGTRRGSARAAALASPGMPVVSQLFLLSEFGGSSMRVCDAAPGHRRTIFAGWVGLVPHRVVCFADGAV